MPFIRIESLPFEQPLDLPEVVRALNRDLSDASGIELNHLHSRWQILPAACYAKGDASPEHQPELKHPLIVELLTPDNLDMDLVARMLETIAYSISRHASFPKNNIFIYHRNVSPGAVFDDGRLASW